MQKTLAILMPLALLAACSSAPTITNAPVTGSASSSGRAQEGETRQVPGAAKPSVSELDDPAGRLAKRNVYFPYDKFTVDAKYEQMISAHADYLAHNPASRVSLEGNADERGSREYNLALGQKRAEAVRNSLRLHGVPDKQMEAVSYGKERPKATCHDEACWQENRRADIAYPAHH